jgi:hypothetical protein
MSKNWYKKAFHRNVIDMHITDCRPEFLSEFDADVYVDMLKKTKAESAVVYTHSHVGLTNFPTKIGKMHPNLHGRDIFKEVNDRCHAAGINVVAYFSLIFDTHAYDENPDWRILRSDGTGFAGKGRYGVCCPNSPGYLAYVLGMTRELCANYEFEGLRYDMTFWPGVCYCPNCKDRFMKEVGGELPVVVDWTDRQWVAFQRCRERWLVEFAASVTNEVRRIKPDVSVEHQSSTFNAPWGLGVPVELSYQNDFLQGDFYGGYVQGSMACKLFHNLTPSLPFGFEACSNESLSDHTTLKTESMLMAKTFMAISNGGAFIFIDAIDPIGTLNPFVYETMGRVFEKTQEYEKYAGGKLIQDVAVYLSTESKFSFDENKMPVDKIKQVESDHLAAMMGASRAMIKNHIPFGVITRKNINELDRWKVIILPDVLMMSEEEVLAIRNYVEGGGRIYASRFTSLTDISGDRKSDFMLSNLFGAHYQGTTEENFTFIAPVNRGKGLFPKNITSRYPISIAATQTIISADADVERLGMQVLPYTNPLQPRPFASIHSNPPGLMTENPSLVRKSYGKGHAVYCSGALERMEYHDGLFAAVIKDLLGTPSFSGNIPRQVEVTLLEKEDGRLLVNLLSFQAEMPNLPIPGFTINICDLGKKVRRVVYIPGEKDVAYRYENGWITFQVDTINTFAMYAIDFVGSNG